MALEVDPQGVSLRLIEKCRLLAEELSRNEPRPAEVGRLLASIDYCGRPGTRNYDHLRQTKVLDRIADGVATALGFHPYAVPEPDEMVAAIHGCKEILYQTLQACGKYQEVLEGEDDFSYHILGIFEEKTFDYNSDRNPMEGDSDQEEHAAMLNNMEHEERYHNSLRARHEYARMVKFLMGTESGRGLLEQFRSELTQSVENGDYPYPPLRTRDLDEFLIG
jgi:hypothetical protein